MQFSLSTVLVFAAAMLAVNTTPLAEMSELQMSELQMSELQERADVLQTRSTEALAPRRIPVAAIVANGRGFNRLKAGANNKNRFKKTKNRRPRTSTNTPQPTLAPQVPQKSGGLCGFLGLSC
ncbi:uncharacterized protein L3040_006991 [Drepanopeziza brunnea f. sp. 'multigermtubi']|uniref:Uncharacterized protein n=1 Tax=Marssonina brunnea f. sp. multigermtubi (strain MB_m1) TaxID=1072389 RepID=K1WVW7_MARBU|nr:uncharacterized protein MBM_09067 [Drepanopeziza brunnea f. sp. 'multigermtubi' MB_m1]EKD12838.1 hypothetical protein MBM_09067 [Drepanopeziza brunnea f. sp. 'multigermtubi' MB_m1]KAJ5038122.1 hypothetical protein L3040_006991 [Drepanopeziza brunnea f. sp. 'multigermtubi']